MIFHRHKFEYAGFELAQNGILAPHGYCINIYKCRKCGKKKCGEIRPLTMVEAVGLAVNYKNKLDNN